VVSCHPFFILIDQVFIKIIFIEKTLLRTFGVIKIFPLFEDLLSFFHSLIIVISKKDSTKHETWWPDNG
jgi:hypothetical protein